MLDAEAKGAVVAHMAGRDRCERFGGTCAEVVRHIRASAEEPAPSVLDRLRARLDGLDPP